MKMDVIAVALFVVLFIAFVIIWSQIEVARFDKQQRERDVFSFQLNYFSGMYIPLVGTGEDGNTDVKVSDAIQHIKLPQEEEIEPYYEEE